jgi:hypothetical protein
MGRKTVKIPIYQGNPEKFSDLIKDIWERHEEMGPSSPLLNNPLVDMGRFEALKTEAFEKRKQALKYYAHAQSLMQHARSLMGVDIGQTINTEDTLYNMVNQIKRYLLVKYPGSEEELLDWGFEVVIRTAKSPVRKKKSAKKG